MITSDICLFLITAVKYFSFYSHVAFCNPIELALPACIITATQTCPFFGIVHPLRFS